MKFSSDNKTVTYEFWITEVLHINAASITKLLHI